MHKVLILFALLYGFTQVHAAEFCVSTADELQTAMTTAQGNNQDNTIKLEQGTYNTADNNTFPDELGFFRYIAASNHDLTISGGWIDFFGTPCGIQIKNPNQTVLDGNNSSKIMFINMLNTGDLTIEFLTFQQANSASSWGGGLAVDGTSPYTDGYLLIQNNQFINNSAVYASAMDLTYYDEIIVRNNLILVNHTTNNYTVHINYIADTYGVFFINNTVYGNTTEGAYADVYIFGSGSTQIMIANNLINNNEGRDLSVDPYFNTYLRNNNLGEWRSGNEALVDTSGNISLPNRFESGFLSFTPDYDSPLVNNGHDPCPVLCPFPAPFTQDWDEGEFDVLGNVRVQNGKVDIGAFESSHEADLIFWDRFETL